MRKLDKEFYFSGGLNDVLFFVFIISRAYYFLYSMIYLYYDDLVRQVRISDIFRFNIDFKTLIRFFYNSNSVYTVLLLLCTSTGILSMLLL